MISRIWFNTKFNKMVHLCGYVVKKEAQDFYFEMLERETEDVLKKTFKDITEDPPTKLTYKILKQRMSQYKPVKEIAMWSGKDCDRCIGGIIPEVIDGYSYTFKCPKCRSYNMKDMEYYSDEAVMNLRMKLEHIRTGALSGDVALLNGRRT